MDPLSENITQAIADFDSIQDAIIEKGVSVPYGTPTSEYGDKIKAIETGGRVSPKDVNFYDYDGMLLHSWSLAEARAATTLPDGPVHERLVFQEWNWLLSDINALIMPADVGATYTTASGASEFDITLTVVTGLSVTLRMYNVTSGNAITVDWGDGEPQSISSTSSGAKSLTHAYAEMGDYIISVDSTGTYYPYSTSTSPYNMFNILPNYTCTAVHLGDRCGDLTGYTFYSCRSIRNATIPLSITITGINTFYICYNLTSIAFPKSILSMLGSTVRGCARLSKSLIPPSVTSIGTYALNSCPNLTKIIVPSEVVNIDANAFSGNYGILEYIMLNSTPPTLAATSVFTDINSLCKIKVPLGSLEAYQTATNWATYADYMVEWEADA